MKPTVSETTTSPAAGTHTRRVVVSSVANSWSAAIARAFVRALNRVDLPALV